MAALEANREAALEAFKAEFIASGFCVPEGLVCLLERFTLKSGEIPEKGRARLYRNLWAKLWFGSKKTLGAAVGCQPTYVFPHTLKRVVREIIPGDLVDKADPTHSGVYLVSIEDLARAKWPAVKPAGQRQR